MIHSFLSFKNITIEKGKTMEKKRFYIKNHTQPIIAYVNIKRNKVIYSLDNEKTHKECSVNEFFFTLEAKEILYKDRIENTNKNKDLNSYYSACDICKNPCILKDLKLK